MRVTANDVEKRCQNIAARWNLDYKFDLGNGSMGISHLVVFNCDGIWSQSLSSRSLLDLYEHVCAFENGFNLAVRIAEKRTDKDIF